MIRSRHFTASLHMTGWRAGSLLLCIALLGAGPVAAQPRWQDAGSPAWKRDSRPGAGQVPTENVDVATFVTKDALAETLGQGSMEVLPAENSDNGSIFEAAVIERLIAAGYDTTVPPGKSGQVTELRITRQEIPSDERPHKPVSGEMMVGVGNRGSAMGMALNIDLSKQPGPLVSTQLEAIVKDRASGQMLWQGRASVTTLQEDTRWTPAYVAGQLATALFDVFPHHT